MEIVELIYGDMVTVIALVLGMTIHSNSQVLVLVDAVAVVFQFWRFLEIYDSIAIMLLSTQYKHHMTLFGFVGKLFIIVHLTVNLT